MNDKRKQIQKEYLKKADSYYVVSELLGRISSVSAMIAALSFLTGLIVSITWDSTERRYQKKYFNTEEENN